MTAITNCSNVIPGMLAVPVSFWAVVVDLISGFLSCFQAYADRCSEFSHCAVL